ncbi:MAG: pitrilysin family protein [Mucinivorans sp.]
MSEYYIYRLASGVRCVRHYSPSPVAHLSITIGAGTRDELPAEHGVAHLVEHLLFKGTTRRSAYRISSALESVGGELNAFTSKEETVIHASAPAEFLGRGTDLLCDIAFNSLFKQSDIDDECEVIIDEINSYKDSPYDLIFDEFEELIFAGSSLGRNILGSKSNIKGIKSVDLKRFTQSNYQPSQVVFALSSSLSVRRFESLCNRVFGSIDWSTHSLASIVRTTPAKLAVFDVRRSKKLHQTHVLLGGYAYSAMNEKRIELALLLNILGGPTSIAFLNQLLREKYVLTYTVEASYSTFVDTGLWSIYFTSEVSKCERAERLIINELQRLSQVEFTPIQLARHKRQFIGQLVMSSENRENTMLSIAKSILLYDGYEENSAIAAKINSLTASSLREVAAEIFAADNVSKLMYY